MKLIRVVKKNDVTEAERKIHELCTKESVKSPSEANGDLTYEFRNSEYNEKNYVEVYISAWSSEEHNDFDKMIRLTEKRLQTLKEGKSKLAKLRAEAKKLGLKIGA